MRKNAVLFGALMFFTTTVYAYVPEPQSEGKYFSSKGTKASEQYETTAGMPIYDYGKGIQWGPVHLKPDAEYRMTWGDNIFYTEEDTDSDYVNSLVLNLDAELPFSGGQHMLSAGYRAHQEWFSRFDEQDHLDQRGTVGLKLNYVPFTLDVENAFERTVSRANTEFTDRIQRDENAFHSLLEVPFAQFFLENEITDFDESFERLIDQTFDHNLFTVYQRVGYDLTPSTQLLGEYAYIGINYDNSAERDGDGHQYMLGARGNFTERIAYQLWAGGQTRVYDEDSRPDFHGVVARGAIQWEPTELNTLLLRGDRAPQESTFDGQSFYTRNRVELTWRRQIAQQWFWRAYGTASLNDYSRITNVAATGESETRRDQVFDAGTGIEYRMPNDIVSIVLDYHFRARESNLDGLDYEASEISAGLRASF